MRIWGAVHLVVGGLLVAACAAEPATGSSSGPVADVPTGSWTLTLTEDDLRAGGFTEAGAFAENTGTFTFTIAPDGSWTIAQVASQPVRWPVFRGTYAVIGADTIEMLTSFPADYAGDLVSVKLTEVPDGLAIKVLSPTDDPLLRTQFESHVWAPSP
jgi:hypothetical protein